MAIEDPSATLLHRREAMSAIASIPPKCAFEMTPSLSFGRSRLRADVGSELVRRLRFEWLGVNDNAPYFDDRSWRRQII